MKKANKAKVVICSNIKGGVAKTTTAATLGAGLVQKGYKVLFVDADPQSNLTMCFMPEPDEGSNTLYKVFAGEVVEKNGKEVTREVPIAEVKVTIKPGMDIVPGDFSLCSADLEFLGEINSMSMLKDALEEEKEQYDFIIIDTPPNVGILTMNAFIAGDIIITPMAADSFSLRAIQLLRKTIDKVMLKANPHLSVAGVLLTKHNERLNSAKSLSATIDMAADLLDTTVYNTTIRQAAVVLESQLYRKDLYDFAPKAPVTQDYGKFVEEFLERLKMEDK